MFTHVLRSLQTRRLHEMQRWCRLFYGSAVTQSVSMSSRTCDGFTREDFRAKRFIGCSKAEWGGIHWPMWAHHPLHSAHFNTPGRRAKVVREKCCWRDPVASVEVFWVPRVKKWERRTGDKQKITCRHWRTMTNMHLQLCVVHTVTLNHSLIVFIHLSF